MSDQAEIDRRIEEARTAVEYDFSISGTVGPLAHVCRFLLTQLDAARADAALLDYLEGELGREPIYPDGGMRSLFRRNQPITREAIRQAMGSTTGETPPGSEGEGNSE